MRRRCRSPSTITWSRHSRRIEPISLSAYGFCHGLDGLDEDFTDPHAGDAAAERVAIDRVAISQQPSRCGIVRKGINDLLRCPCGRRMLGDVEMDNPPAVVREQDEDEEDSAGESVR